MYFIFITGITLDDHQTDKMSNLITAIDSTTMGTAILKDIYKEAEESGEGRGEVLKEIWRESQDQALFFFVIRSATVSYYKFW